MELSLGFSSCPNDTYIFDAMINKRIDTEDLVFRYHLADVEELNGEAMLGENDISKISYNAMTRLSEKYILLNSGSALGFNNGPLLISSRKISEDELPGLRIAIPGKFTTANLLMAMIWPSALNKVEYLFSDIEDAVLEGEVDAGLIIHENRFTYSEKGLKLIADLGKIWDGMTGMPIPLGGIAIKRSLPTIIQQKVDRIMRKSVDFAFSNPDLSRDFVSKYADAMDSEVIRKHISLYVNEFTYDLGAKGREAVRFLFSRSRSAGIITSFTEPLFVSSDL